MYWIVASLVESSSPVPLKTRRVGERCMLNLSGLKCPRWCSVEVRRGVASSGVVLVDHGSKLRGYSPIALMQLKWATLILTHSPPHHLRATRDLISISLST
ncbi:hypothetical protein TNCV_4991471 [Trichonephila clavipes]|nr:hypothetical protein TNCV_4991471 [Trichonephila clavipes]